METLFADGRNLFSHDDLNKLHLKVEKNKAVALKEAVEKLLDTTTPIVIDTEYSQNRGDRRYLEKCLLQQGALVQKKSVGAKLQCEFEGSAGKYAGKLPALAAMVREVESLPADGQIRLADWAARYRKPPFGQGSVALALFLACLRRKFGDSIRIKMDASAVGDMPLRTFEEILALSEGTYSNAFLSYKPLTKVEKDFARASPPSLGPREPPRCASTPWLRLTTHSSSGPPSCRLWPASPSCTPEDKHLSTGAFLLALQRLEALDAHAFLFDELPFAFGFDRGGAITEGNVQALEAELRNQKEVLERAPGGVEERIFNGVRALFNVQGSTVSDTLEAMTAWYNGLDSQQRDAHGGYHSNESKPLVTHLQSATDWRETFLTKIPNSPDYGMRAVRDWSGDRVEEYLSRLQSGKAHIEANRIKVEPPQIKPSGSYEWTEGKTAVVSGQGEVGLRYDSGGCQDLRGRGQQRPHQPALAARANRRW
jgi:hypothetical protein